MKLDRNDYQKESDAEYDYILDFVESYEGYDVLEMNQIRCLWTAYCLHKDLIVDTSAYDSQITKIWNLMQEVGNCPYSSLEYERFYNSMCKYLM